MLKKSKILKSDHGETHFNHILMKTQVAASLLKKKMSRTWKITTVHNFYMIPNKVHNEALHLYRGFKIFLLFEADEKSFIKFLPSNEDWSSPHQEIRGTL